VFSGFSRVYDCIGVKMDIVDVLKIVGIALIVSVSCQILTKNGRDEQASLVSVSGIIIVVFMIVSQFSSLIAEIKTTFGL